MDKWLRLSNQARLGQSSRKLMAAAKLNPLRNPCQTFSSQLLLAKEESKTAIPIKAHGQKPQGGTDAAISSPASKDLISE